MGLKQDKKIVANTAAIYRARIAALKAENAKLRKCVEAADEMRGAMTDLGGCYDVRSSYVDNFDAARKETP